MIRACLTYFFLIPPFLTSLLFIEQGRRDGGRRLLCLWGNARSGCVNPQRVVYYVLVFLYIAPCGVSGKPFLLEAGAVFVIFAQASVEWIA